MADEYDIVKAIQKIEDELIASIIRNMRKHKVEEVDEDKQWIMWQVEQLKSLEKFKKQNQKKYGKVFKSINKRIEALIGIAKDEGEMEQEIEILNAIKKGFKGMKKTTAGLTAEFFKLNERKLEALIKATVDDMENAEMAILRRVDDQYRKIIYDAQVYANTGAGTYEKAVDMATKDFLASGIQCVEYANGARHTLSDYADMAIRTASKRAYLQGEGVKRQEWGITTVIMNKRGNPCPKCLPFCGKVLVDDVWSGGRSDGIDPETGKKYPTMSYAISQGLYHPRCLDSHTTYFLGISTADDTWTDKELEDIGLQAKQEAKQQYAKRQAEKFERLAKYSLDEENRKLYTARKKQWESVANNQKNDIIRLSGAKEEADVHIVGRIDREIYKCITEDIVTDEVIITDNQIQHIKDRHPNDYERFSQYFSEIIANPDYILEANKPNTAFVLKQIEKDGVNFQLILRLRTSQDPEGYKNSVITFLKIEQKKWDKYLRNKKILYRRE